MHGGIKRKGVLKGTTTLLLLFLWGGQSELDLGALRPTVGGCSLAQDVFSETYFFLGVDTLDQDGWNGWDGLAMGWAASGGGAMLRISCLKQLKGLPQNISTHSSVEDDTCMANKHI